jgi:hypothetical protein
MQEPTLEDDLKTSFNLSIWALIILSLPLEVLLHFNFGKRYLGLSALIAFLWFFIFAAYNEVHGSPMPLILAGYGYIGLVVFRSIQAKFCTLRLHSYYNGYPLCCLLVDSTISELECKAYLEPTLAALAGFGLLYVNSPLGRFVMVSATALAIKNQFNAKLIENHELDRQDAMIEYEQQAEQFRHRNHW